MVNFYRFNDMTDFDIDVQPGDVWEELNSFNCDFFDSQMKLDLNVEKKHIKLRLEEPVKLEELGKNSKFCVDEPLQIEPLEVKIKFYHIDHSNQDEEEKEEGKAERYRVKFILKKGCQADWFELF